MVILKRLQYMLLPPTFDLQNLVGHKVILQITNNQSVKKSKKKQNNHKHFKFLVVPAWGQMVRQSI